MCITIFFKFYSYISFVYLKDKDRRVYSLDALKYSIKLYIISLVCIYLCYKQIMYIQITCLSI